MLDWDVILRDRFAAGSHTVSSVARDSGIDPAQLRRFLDGKASLSLASGQRLARSLGLDLLQTPQDAPGSIADIRTVDSATQAQQSPHGPPAASNGRGRFPVGPSAPTKSVEGGTVERKTPVVGDVVIGDVVRGSTPGFGGGTEADRPVIEVIRSARPTIPRSGSLVPCRPLTLAERPVYPLSEAQIRRRKAMGMPVE